MAYAQRYTLYKKSFKTGATITLPGNLHGEQTGKQERVPQPKRRLKRLKGKENASIKPILRLPFQAYLAR